MRSKTAEGAENSTGMASKPDFDPNDPQDFSANLTYLTEQVQAEPELYTIYKKDENGNYLRDENGQKIADEEADYTGTYRDIQWKNKTITELYYPGSVFKVITAAMGVDSGKATYYTTFNCSGAYGVAKETYHCAGKKAHGVQNLAEALRNSCNIYFIQLGQRVGSSLFYDYFDAFGFTEGIKQSCNKLCCARAGVNHDHCVVIVDVQHQVF